MPTSQSPSENQDSQDTPSDPSTTIREGRRGDTIPENGIEVSSGWFASDLTVLTSGLIERLSTTEHTLRAHPAVHTSLNGTESVWIPLTQDGFHDYAVALLPVSSAEAGHSLKRALASCPYDKSLESHSRAAFLAWQNVCGGKNTKLRFDGTGVKLERLENWESGLFEDEVRALKERSADGVLFCVEWSNIP